MNVPQVAIPYHALDTSTRDGGLSQPIGDPLDVALLEAAMRAGLEERQLRLLPRIAEQPFDARRAPLSPSGARWAPALDLLCVHPAAESPQSLDGHSLPSCAS